VRLSRGSTVYVDRDWLSSLSYAYSIGGTDAAVMLRQRAAWAVACLREGTLLLPACYVIFDLDPCTSLNRRSGRLTQAHPWNHPEALLRLRRFYADPVQALRPADQGLADILGGATRLQVCGCDDPQQILHQIMTVSGQP
jgi:thymidylate kinase